MVMPLQWHAVGHQSGFIEVILATLCALQFFMLFYYQQALNVYSDRQMLRQHLNNNI